ncbi:MAG: hypothetical protein Tsb0015_15090 [Simkaniaceae bacterium]
MASIDPNKKSFNALTAYFRVDPQQRKGVYLVIKKDAQGNEYIAADKKGFWGRLKEKFTGYSSLKKVVDYVSKHQEDLLNAVMKDNWDPKTLQSDLEKLNEKIQKAKSGKYGKRIQKIWKDVQEVSFPRQEKEVPIQKRDLPGLLQQAHAKEPMLPTVERKVPISGHDDWGRVLQSIPEENKDLLNELLSKMQLELEKIEDPEGKSKKKKNFITKFFGYYFGTALPRDCLRG